MLPGQSSKPKCRAHCALAAAEIHYRGGDVANSTAGYGVGHFVLTVDWLRAGGFDEKIKKKCLLGIFPLHSPPAPCRHCAGLSPPLVSARPVLQMLVLVLPPLSPLQLWLLSLGCSR